MSAESASESRPSFEALIRKRADGEFDIVCKNCSQVLAVAMNERAGPYSAGAVIGTLAAKLPTKA